MDKAIYLSVLGSYPPSLQSLLQTAGHTLRKRTHIWLSAVASPRLDSLGRDQQQNATSDHPENRDSF